MLCKALLLLASIGTCLSASAAPITVEQAKMAVHTWASARPQAHMDAKLGKSAGAASSVTNGAGEVLFHVVKLEGGGFVVTSADDTITPVIAFSECADLDRNERNPLWAMLNKDLPQRKVTPPSLLSKSVAHNSTPSAADEWADLLGKGSSPLLTGRSSISDVRVAVMLKTKWGQGEVNGDYLYNKYTPNNYVCGCVATAGAQLMRYHRYPTSEIVDGVTDVSFKCRVNGSPVYKKIQGYAFDGSEQFMPNDPKTELSSMAALDALIAKMTMGAIFYDVGVISRMNWGKNGSDAFLFVLADSMVNYYDYSNARYMMDIYGISSSNFKNAIYASLDSGNPVLLGINNSAGNIGHAIVADGYGYYNSSIYTHLNLGWEGDSDVWYALPTIDTGDYRFTVVNVIVYNVFPHKTGELITGRVLMPSGSAKSGVTVKATSGSSVVTGTTDSKGIYALWVTGGKTWDVQPSLSGYEADSQPVTVKRSVSTSYSLDGDGGLIEVGDYEKGVIGNVWGVDFTLEEHVDPPSAPTGVSATEDSSTGVTIRWSAVTGASGYYLLRIDESLDEETSVLFYPTSTSYVDTTAEPGKVYIYSVAAYNKAGMSDVDGYVIGMRAVSLSVFPETQQVVGAGGMKTVAVTANADWTSSCDVGWIVLNSASGTGNGTLSYTIQPNTTTSARSGSITVFAGAGTEDERTAVLEVSQNRSPVSVTFDAAGGLPTGEVRKLEVGSAYGALPSPSRLGYSLAGWYDGETQVTASSLVPSRDVTLRAKWRANTSTVSFHSEHLGIGAGSMGDQTFDYGTSAALAGCGFTRVGYAFAGWATEQGGPVRYRDGQDILNLSAEDGAKLDFYAVWEEGKPAGSVKVTACAAAPRWPWNGKVDVDYTLACEPVTGKATVKLSARDNDRQRDLQPKTLAGGGANGAVGSGTHRLTWDVAADYPGFDTTALDVNVEASVETIPAVANVTASQGTSEGVELTWSPVDKAVAYEIWRSESDDMQSAILLKTVEELKMEDTEAVRGVRYWYWIRPLGERVTGAFSDSIGGCRPLEAVSGLIASAGHVVQGKVTLSWNSVTSAIRYEIFRGISGDFAMATKQVEVTGTSWADESAMEDVRYYYWVVAAGEQCFGMRGSPVCGYWERKQVTIAFDGNGIDLGLAALVRKEGDKVGPLPSPMRVGYDFSGWYTASAGGQKLTEDSEVAGSGMTLHAHWTAHTYTVVFDGVGNTMPSVKMTYDVRAQLPLRTYDNNGYMFSGWKCGSKELYDHQTVVNLTSENNAVVHLQASWVEDDNRYLVIDVSGGPNAANYPTTFLKSMPIGGWTDEYKTDKIVLRRIDAGAFMMGSPEGEYGRSDNEYRHEVVIDHWVFIGVFEVTATQYRNVMGAGFDGMCAAYGNKIADVGGCNWTYSSDINYSKSFVSKLRAKTIRAGFDNTGFRLPTEAEWEYACRAGTDAALYNGKELTSLALDDELSKLGRHNLSSGSDNVGCRLPNAFGLYDMLGGASELCYDSYDKDIESCLGKSDYYYLRGEYTDAIINPRNDSSGDYVTVRGGSKYLYAERCRCASRDWATDNKNAGYKSDVVGFRLVWTRWL